MTGSTYVAYRHPQGFQTLYVGAMAVTLATVLLCMGYEVFLAFIEKAVVDRLSSTMSLEEVPEVREAFDVVDPDLMKYFFVVWTPAWLYVLFLSRLPELGIVYKESDSHKDAE